MAKVGYARVSSYGQSLDVQLERLAECDKVFSEKKSGKTDDREQLKAVLEWVRDGDVLVVTKLDRLARSTRDLLNIVNKLDDKGVELRVLDQNIDTGTPTGKLMLAMLGAIAEFENDLRRERQMDGIQMAKKKGVQLGRKKKLDDEELARLRERHASGEKVSDLATYYQISRMSVYRLLERNDQQSEKL